MGSLVLNQQDSNRGKVGEGEKRGIQLIISGSNSPKPLDFLKEILNRMSFLVQMLIYYLQCMSLRSKLVANNLLPCYTEIRLNGQSYDFIRSVFE